MHVEALVPMPRLAPVTRGNGLILIHHVPHVTACTVSCVVGRAAHVEDTRRRILRAAREGVVAHGYHGIALERVAVDAGVTRVTVTASSARSRGCSTL